MAGRLGTVLFWIGCILAGLTSLLAATIYLSSGYNRNGGAIAVIAVLVIAFVFGLAGYGLRYILCEPEDLIAGTRSELTWAEQYAERIYGALPASDDLGDMTPERLRIPSAAVPRYHEKSLQQRESLCMVALMTCAGPKTDLPSVMLAYARLVTEKWSARGMPLSMDKVVNTCMRDTEELHKDPTAWSQKWIAEFRSGPDDVHMVAMFADHFQRQFNAYKHAIEKTYKA